MENINYISKLNYQDKETILSICQLHQSLIPTSPVAMLGLKFLKQFYYPQLTKNNLLFCEYYKYDQKIVGFITYTTEPEKFVKIGIKKSFFNFIFALTASIFEDYRRFIYLLKGSQLEKAHHNCDTGEAAVVSFGVLPYYRSREFTKKSKLYISNDLFANAMDSLNKLGFRKLRMIVEPNNIEALLFYQQFNSVVEPMNTFGRTWIKVTLNI